MLLFTCTDVRIRRLMEEKNELSDQLRRLKLDLEEEKSKTLYRERTPVTVSTPVSPNGPVADLTEWQSNSFSLQSLYLFGIFFCWDTVAWRTSSSSLPVDSYWFACPAWGDPLGTCQLVLEKQIRERNEIVVSCSGTIFFFFAPFSFFYYLYSTNMLCSCLNRFYFICRGRREQAGQWV